MFSGHPKLFPAAKMFLLCSLAHPNEYFTNKLTHSHQAIWEVFQLHNINQTSFPQSKKLNDKWSTFTSILWPTLPPRIRLNFHIYEFCCCSPPVIFFLSCTCDKDTTHWEPIIFVFVLPLLRIEFLLGQIWKAKDKKLWTIARCQEVDHQDSENEDLVLHLQLMLMFWKKASLLHFHWLSLSQ